MERAPEPSSGRLRAADLALLGLVGAVLSAAMFAGDGSDTGGILPVGGSAVVVLAGALVLAALRRLPAPRLGRSGLALAAALLALVTWLGATIAWSVAPDRSWDAFNRGLAFAAFLGLGLVLAAALRGSAVRAVAALLALAVASVLGWALLGKALPSLDPEGDLVARLNEPVDYWNALALLADIGLVLGLWLAVSPAHRAWTRIAGGLLVYVAALSLALTLSRVGLVAGALVLALWLSLSRERVEGALVLAAAGSPAVAVAGWAFTRPALVEAGAVHEDRVADGAVFGLLAIAAAIAAGGLVLLALRARLEQPRRARATRALVALGALAAAAGVVGGGVAVANAIASGRSCAEVANEPSRLVSLDLNSRWCWWNEAWDVFRAHPVEGAGASTFEVARKRYREDARAVRQPHSVPLQQLADAGIPGLVLFLALVAAAAAVCVCALRRLGGRERAAAVALVAAPAAYLVHSPVDYGWDFLATTAPVLAVLGVLAAASRPPARRGGGRPAALAAGALTLAFAVLVSFVAPRVSETSVRASTRALLEDDLARARARAERARDWNPIAVGPLVALARVEQRSGDLSAAQRFYVDAVELQPENPETWYALGVFELDVREDACSAYRFLNEAYTRDPAGRQWFPGGPLDLARDAVNAGACAQG